MRRMLLHPTSGLPDDTPVEQIRLPWHIRRTLNGAGLITVGNVRKAATETLLRLKMGHGGGSHPRNARLNGKSRPEAPPALRAG